MAKAIKFLRDDLVSIFRKGIRSGKTYGFTIFDDHSLIKGKQLFMTEGSIFDCPGVTSAYVSAFPSGMFANVKTLWRIITEVIQYFTFFGWRFNGYLNEKQCVKEHRLLITQIVVSTDKNVTGFIPRAEKRRLRLILAVYWIVSFFLYRKTAVFLTHHVKPDGRLPLKDLSLSDIANECYRVEINKKCESHIIRGPITRPLSLVGLHDGGNVYGYRIQSDSKFGGGKDLHYPYETRITTRESSMPVHLVNRYGTKGTISRVIPDSELCNISTERTTKRITKKKVAT